MLDAKAQGAEKFIAGEKCTPQFGFLGREGLCRRNLFGAKKKSSQGCGLIGGKI
jgi:hypothetical protein